MNKFISAKIQNLTVTDKSILYNGSVSVCKKLMKKVKMKPYQMAIIINLNNGNRWETYLIPTKKGEFTLNGGGARLGEIGDKCVILTYSYNKKFKKAKCIYCNKNNQVKKEYKYENS